jgi:hypothetical protein
MNDFGRVPLLDVEEVDKPMDKEIFDKPAPSTAPPTVPLDEKKMKLKEHLAKCRLKSAEVRKAKALEKKVNKKPVGRPKRVAEKMVLDIEDTPPVSHLTAKDNTEEEIFVPAVKVLPTIKEDKELSPPPTNNMFDMDMMLNKFDERMNQKLKAFQTPAPPPTPQHNMGIDPNVYGFVSYMKDQEEKIRNEERTKYVNELEQKKNDLLLQNNRKYFKKLPSRQFHQPVQHYQQAPQENNMWDDLLNPKRKY